MTNNTVNYRNHLMFKKYPQQNYTNGKMLKSLLWKYKKEHRYAFIMHSICHNTRGLSLSIHIIEVVETRSTGEVKIKDYSKQIAWQHM